MKGTLLSLQPTIGEIQLFSVLAKVDFDLDKSFSRYYGTGRPRKMKFSWLMEVLELKTKYSCETWKGLYNCILENRRDWEIPCYGNFLISIKSLGRFLIEMINLKLYTNRQEFLCRKDKIVYIDSTCLPVCKVIRSSRHKTMSQYAQYSKSTMGWYYGFKLHLVCDYKTQKPLAIKMSNSKLDDRQFLKFTMLHPNLFYQSGTMFVADKGYSAKWLDELAVQTGNYLLTGKKVKSKSTAKSNTKPKPFKFKKTSDQNTLASWLDIYLLHNRAKIETLFSNLKLNFNLTSTRSRSVLGYLFTYITAIFTLLQRKS